MKMKRMHSGESVAKTAGKGRVVSSTPVAMPVKSTSRMPVQQAVPAAGKRVKRMK